MLWQGLRMAVHIPIPLPGTRYRERSTFSALPERYYAPVGVGQTRAVHLSRSNAIAAAAAALLLRSDCRSSIAALSAIPP